MGGRLFAFDAVQVGFCPQVEGGLDGDRAGEHAGFEGVGVQDGHGIGGGSEGVAGPLFGASEDGAVLEDDGGAGKIPFQSFRPFNFAGGSIQAGGKSAVIEHEEKVIDDDGSGALGNAFEAVPGQLIGSEAAARRVVDRIRVEVGFAVAGIDEDEAVGEDGGRGIGKAVIEGAPSFLTGG